VAERTVCVELSEDDFASILCALEREARNESGCLTAKGVRAYLALVARLQPQFDAMPEPDMSVAELAAAILEAHGFGKLIFPPFSDVRVGFPCNDPSFRGFDLEPVR
jgi:hypothetical protein